jgi:hypothetical protein
MTIAKAQENLYSYNVARQVCEVNTKDMGTIYNPYTNLPGVSDGAVSSETYTIGTQVTTADSLQVNRRADASEHVNSYDWKSVGFGLIADRGMNYGLAISQQIDRYTMAFAVGNATTALDDGDFGGTAGNAKTSSATVIDDIINLGIESVDVLDGHGKKKFMVVSPREANDLRSFMQNNGHTVADKAIERGIAFVGTTFSGVDIYQTNNLRNTAVLGMATQPTADDSVTINGVVFQFVASIGNAGDIHIGTAVDNTRLNFSVALNAPGTAIAESTEAGYTVVSTQDQDKLARLALTAVDSAGGDTLTITANATLILSETLTDATDAWAAVERQLVGGNYGSIYLALPTQGMDYHEKEVSGKAGVELFMEQFYNVTVWTRKADQLFTCKVN